MQRSVCTFLVCYVHNGHNMCMREIVITLCDSSTCKKFQGSLYFAKRIFTIIFMERLSNDTAQL